MTWVTSPASSRSRSKKPSTGLSPRTFQPATPPPTRWYPPGGQSRASVVAKGEGILAGGDVAVAVWRRLDASIRVLSILPDGSKLRPADPASGREGDAIAEIEGDTAAILKGERTAINFLQHLSGVATETNRFVRAVEGLPARIVDTRKTVPGLRILQKYAVRVGGGSNHRINLGDGVLIKDNHIEALRAEGAGLAEAVRRARVRHTLRVEVEVETTGPGVGCPGCRG